MLFLGTEWKGQKLEQIVSGRSPFSDNFTTVHAADGAPDADVDVFADKADRAIAEADLGTAGMEAACSEMASVHTGAADAVSQF